MMLLHHHHHKQRILLNPFTLLPRRWQSRHCRSVHKPIVTSDEAVSEISSGSTILMGGFGLCGIPENLLRSLASQSTIKNLHLVSIDACTDDYGVGPVIRQHQIDRLTCCFLGANRSLQEAYLKGEIDIELTPMGTLAEKLRGGGAGIPAFYVRTGADTDVENGQLIVRYGPNLVPQVFSRPKEYVLEETIRGDIALVKGWKADLHGNVVFHRTARNSNPLMAKAALKEVIVEVEEIVPAGNLDPEAIHLPGIYVDKLVLGERYEKPIEQMHVLEETTKSDNIITDSRHKIAQRLVKEFKDGMYINLGIGIPTLASQYLTKDLKVHIQIENGALDIGSYPSSSDLADPDLINPGKEPVTMALGSSFFSIDESFGMIRGRHVDLTVLGTMEVSERGDLANWIVPGKLVRGMGGAMDLAESGAMVSVATEHTTKDGRPKIVKYCDLPLTASKCVRRIITELAVFDVDPKHGLTLVEVAAESSVEEVQERTGCKFRVINNGHKLKTF